MTTAAVEVEVEKEEKDNDNDGNEEGSDEEKEEQADGEELQDKEQQQEGEEGQEEAAMAVADSPTNLGSGDEAAAGEEKDREAPPQQEGTWACNVWVGEWESGWLGM